MLSPAIHPSLFVWANGLVIRAQARGFHPVFGLGCALHCAEVHFPIAAQLYRSRGGKSRVYGAARVDFRDGTWRGAIRILMSVSIGVFLFVSRN